MDLKYSLTQTFNSNFVAYYRSHVAHANTVGRNFYADHKLLQKIYEDLQGNIDILAELLRSIRAKMPMSLMAVTADSAILDDDCMGDSDELLRLVYIDQQLLIEQYRDLYTTAEEEGMVEIANYAQDRILTHQKFSWMLRSTLEDETEDDYQD